jgi:predicted nucleic acid-binding Zn ribbon protein
MPRQTYKCDSCEYEEDWYFPGSVPETFGQCPEDEGKMRKKVTNA